MQIFLVILYVLVGVLLAFPYCLLAGWSADDFRTVVFVAPAFLFVWFMAATFAGIIESDGYRKIYFNWRAAFGRSNHSVLPWSLSIFWAWTIYSSLPIIFHWGAVLLGNLGYETAGSLLDTHRYVSVFYVFVSTIVLLIIIDVMMSAWDVAKSAWTRLVRR